MTTKMKYSGIEWIKEIPASWNLVKIKYLATEKNSLFLDGDWIESDIIEESGIRYLTTGNIGAGYYKNQGSGYISEKTFNNLHCLKVFPNDLMISRLNEPIGRACILPDDEDCYIVAVDNVILRPNKNYNKKFIMYAMNTDGYAEHGNMVARGATMSRVSRSQLGQFWITIPSLHEQTLIANFLDEQCGKIDRITADIERQIEVLEEYKKSLITETVTKGLDKTVPMKDSGIEYIGQIPEDWEVTPLKYISICNKDVLSENTNPSLTFNYVDIGSVTYEKGIQEFQEIKFEDSPSRARRIVCLGDTLISTVRTYLKAIAYVDKTSNFIASTGFAVISASQRLFPKYLYYFCKSEGFIQEVDKYSYGIAYPSINTELLLKIKVSYSEYKEQTLIANYLDEKCSQIDAIISSKKEQLNKISEHRKSLIYEYVTGKKRVKGVHQHGN